MLTDEIKSNWYIDITGHAQPIKTLADTEYPAWTVKFVDSYGVAIPYSGVEINEVFSNARIYSSVISFDNSTKKKALLLTTDSTDITSAFSTICAELVDPGENGIFRKEIMNSPVSWWREWKDLLGNKNIDDRVYDVLGELCVLNQIIENGEDASWNGPDGASYDIETDKRFVEVKSSVVRDRKEVTISNPAQLDPPGKPLDLVFCQFEPTVASGFSINSVLSQLEKKGMNIGEINRKLKELGFEEGRSSRNRTFILHNMLKYPVDSDFPRLTKESFVGGVLPVGITKYSYTVDLSGMTPESMLQGEPNEV